MVSNRRIRIALGRTVNLGNFESLRVDVEISADILDDESLGVHQEELFYQVKTELEERIEELTPKKNKLRRGTAPSEGYE